MGALRAPTGLHFFDAILEGTSPLTVSNDILIVVVTEMCGGDRSDV